MMTFALQRQPEGGGRVGPALLLGLADHPRQATSISSISPVAACSRFSRVEPIAPMVRGG